MATYAEYLAHAASRERQVTHLYQFGLYRCGKYEGDVGPADRWITLTVGSPVPELSRTDSRYCEACLRDVAEKGNR